jgi:CTP:molybdopterin cytidylyltransferase MocA
LASTAAIVLAAGAGSRFDGADHKLVTPFRGRPLFHWALLAAIEVGFAEVFVVTGPVDLATEIDALIRDHTALDATVTVVANQRWAEGQATSLSAGVNAARRGGYQAVVVGLADQPLVPSAAWAAVAGADGPVAAACFDGRRRPPVKFDHSIWDLLPQRGDEGARALLHRRPDLVKEVPCSGNPVDIDTLEDLHQWN